MLDTETLIDIVAFGWKLLQPAIHKSEWVTPYILGCVILSQRTFRHYYYMAWLHFKTAEHELLSCRPSLPPTNILSSSSNTCSPQPHHNCHQCHAPPSPPRPPCPPPIPVFDDNVTEEVRVIAMEHLTQLENKMKELHHKRQMRDRPGICLCSTCQSAAMNSNYPTSNLSSYPLLRDVNKYIILRTCSRHWEQEISEINNKLPAGSLKKQLPLPDKMFIPIDKAVELFKLYLQDQVDLYGCDVDTNMDTTGNM